MCLRVSTNIDNITCGLHIGDRQEATMTSGPFIILQFVTIARGPNLRRAIGPNSSGSIKGYNTHDKRVL